MTTRRQSLEQLLLEVEFLNKLRTHPCGYISAPKRPYSLRYELGQWLIEAGRWVRDG